MAVKKMSIAQLQRAQARGADIERKTTLVDVANISEVTQMLGKLSAAVAESKPDSASEELSRISKAIESIKIQAPAVDMTPVLEAIKATQIALAKMNTQRKPARYEFDVQRDERGRISKVVAEPKDGL